MKPTAEVVQTSPAVEVVEVPTPVIFEPVETPQPWIHEEVAALAEIYFREGKTEHARDHQPDYLRLSQAERERAEAEKQAAENGSC